MLPVNTGRSRRVLFTIVPIHYEICVAEIAEGFFRARWNCPDCAETGAYAPISAEAGQAIDLAKVCIKMHHGLLHQRGLTSALN